MIGLFGGVPRRGVVLLAALLVVLLAAPWMANDYLLTVLTIGSGYLSLCIRGWDDRRLEPGHRPHREVRRPERSESAGGYRQGQLWKQFH